MCYFIFCLQNVFHKNIKKNNSFAPKCNLYHSSLCLDLNRLTELKWLWPNLQVWSKSCVALNGTSSTSSHFFYIPASLTLSLLVFLNFFVSLRFHITFIKVNPLFLKKKKRLPIYFLWYIIQSLLEWSLFLVHYYYLLKRIL